MDEIAFKHIVPRLGGQREAFEELCCQIARRTVPSGTKFVRLHGAGGDGGVECFADLVDGRALVGLNLSPSDVPNVKHRLGIGTPLGKASPRRSSGWTLNATGAIRAKELF
jgi:hypothetical protein